MFRATATAIFVALLMTAAHAGVKVTPADERAMVVHEWGTFTVLQAEDGRPIAGINTDDEPLPRFVHDLHSNLMQTPTEVPPVYFKGTPRVHPDVIVRLETPVIYFYPPKGVEKQKVDVNVEFRGGWLTQFYPDAKADAPSIDQRGRTFGRLTPQTTGKLDWNNLAVAGMQNGPQTDSAVWLAPREVKATSVTTPAGESERYLFYRGVGHLQAPLRCVREGGEITVHNQPHPLAKDAAVEGPLWLVDVRDDGVIAFRTVDRMDAASAGGHALARFAATFTPDDYRAGNFRDLRAAMHRALVKEGLFADEADAMLNTWEVSYFKRPGLRLFFMTPQAWNEAVLPLKVTVGDGSVAPKISRAMIGRIELVKPEQRALLRRLGEQTPSSTNWVFEALKKAGGGREDFYREEWFTQIMNGARSLTSANVEMPDDWRLYLALGRFRNALILDEQARRPNENLKKFIDQYALEGHEVSDGK